ncbi:MAG: fused MFS/spermidine synthase [Pirellulales bacterium]
MTNRLLATLYAAVIFISAFLLFQVQPLIGKCILPWFGGSPAVWTTCMLMFQILLFGGYVYAHLLSHYFPPKKQVIVHTTLILLAIATLPIAPDIDWKPVDSQAPAGRIMLLLLVCIGLPYFLLSSTSPLIQSWFSRTNPGQSPYRLYSLSNVGSLLALISYPFVFEPALSTISQSWLWSFGFIGFAAICGICGWLMARQVTTSMTFGVPNPASSGHSPTVDSSTVPTPSDRLLWFGLAATATILLLATTNQVCLDVAVVPFLWVLPLALYLITFILCFDGKQWYHRLLFVGLVLACLISEVLLAARGADVSIVLQIVVYFGAMFCSCMVCHGELAAMKPHPKYLTSYFLVISAGGAAGGLFVALIAPLLFVNYSELHFGFLLFMMLFFLIRLREDQVRLPLPKSLRGPTAIVLVVIVIFVLTKVDRHEPWVESSSRNFYGVLKVRLVPSAAGELRQLAHGRIAHGSQLVEVEKRLTPTAYYARNTAVGQLLTHFKADEPRRIGIVGLGVGTLAAYGQPEDQLRFYEINPDVTRLAQSHFSFLAESKAKWQVVQGDARLSLEFEKPQQFDVLVLDAFSGDAIPVHLLTREAIEVYLRHMREDAVLACHISNLHFDLQPVLRGLADEFDLQCKIVGTAPEASSAGLATIWALLSKESDSLATVDGKSDLLGDSVPTGRLIQWTDTRSNLLDVLK